VVDIDDRRARDLFAGTPYYLPFQEPSADCYDISPDGREIAFMHDFDPDPVAPSLIDIVLLDLKSGKSVSPTRNSGRSDECPRYSPDGRYIAYLSTDVNQRYNDQARLALITRSDRSHRLISQRWDRAVNPGMVWSGDSKAVYFTAETEVAAPIWRMTVAGARPTEVVRGPGYGGSVSAFALAQAGTTLVYTRSSLAHPPRLFAANADGTHERAIESFNAALLARVKPAAAESVTVKGAHGDDVQMWVIKPPQFDAKKKWPLLHSIHGGPHTCFGDVWHWRWNAQVFAAQGYVVAMVNYHGSTGWGQKFISSIDGDWGWREMADVEAGTDYLLKTGWIDKNRVAASGGSYGGYMVAYMNGHAKPGRYQAYVCHAGCYDWVAMMGSDAYQWTGRELGAFPWEDPARVLKQSPHAAAKAFATPTLVIHGALDYRVPYEQGLAYYNTLRVKKVPARLVYFPDENHWILKPQNSLLWYNEFFDWCKRWTAPTTSRSRAR
jgi:dipeptidyl aminopeptidase/acylaminoacyl peptidase